MLRAKLISSLEKCFTDESVLEKRELTKASFLKNERFSFQVCYDNGGVAERGARRYTVRIESPLKDYIRVYNVRQIPSFMPCFPDHIDENYLRTEPGLYPDLLEPFDCKNDRIGLDTTLRALWFEIDPKGAFDGSIYPVKIVIQEGKTGETVAEVSLEAEIINDCLPEQTLIYTQWFYTDCLMDRYRVRAWSERHWNIIENFMKNAVKYGQNMILTPIFTPALDTYEGGERPTTQLVEITKTETGYEFDFSRLGRWVDLCDKVGIRYLEICHLYSQWGATACPKVMAKVRGKTKRIFGWDSPADGEEYKTFLSTLLPQMISYLREEKQGADKRCFFHISDEPGEAHAPQYEKLSRFLSPILKDYPIIDALSEPEYYDRGLVKHPIPPTDRIEPFLERKIENLWTYYCCSEHTDVSNRFFSMPSARNRIIGLQFYKYRIGGFLHWGYNNYNTQKARSRINPFLFSDGDCWVPSGDAFSVYPGEKGQPWPSLRQVVFFDALQDLRALQRCEELYGRETVLRELERDISPITFRTYPKDGEWLLNLRERINQLIKEKI